MEPSPHGNTRIATHLDATDQTAVAASGPSYGLGPGQHSDMPPPDTHQSIIPSGSVSLQSTSQDPQTKYSEYTDLDAVISHIEKSKAGDDYEALLMLSQFIGQADHPKKPPSISLASLLKGEVELERRRVLGDGRIKLKLRLLGLAVNKCGICLSQFKASEVAYRTRICAHSFHQPCLDRWLRDNTACPMCRVPLRE